MRKYISLFFVIAISCFSLSAQNVVFPKEYDLVLKTGQEFALGEASFFIDDIEVIKKNKFCSVVKISSTNDTYEITIAEKDTKNSMPVYYTYSIIWVSSYKYNDKEYIPFKIFSNHFFLKQKVEFLFDIYV